MQSATSSSSVASCGGSSNSNSSGGGIKRTASSALVSDAVPPVSPSTSSSNTAMSSGDGTVCKDEPGGGGDSPPPEKRSFIVIESPMKLGSVTSSEDLDIKVLRIQNKNLSDRLQQRQKLEADLRERIDQLQSRKVADDNKLCLMDRYWTQLDEDMRLMLERFDETANSLAASIDDDSNSKAANKENSTVDAAQNNQKSAAPAKSSVRQFLTKLNDWDRSELEEALKERVKFTTQTLAKLISNYERLVKKNDLYFKELGQCCNAANQEQSNANVQAKISELHQENIRLNDLIIKCELKFHTHGLEKKQLEDKIYQLENDLKEMSKRSGETEYELDRIRDKAFKLDRQLADSLIKLNNAQKIINNSGDNNHLNNNHCDRNGHIILPNNFNSGTSTNSNSNNKLNDKAANLTDKQLSDMEFELEQQRELANGRLHELEKLNMEYQASAKQIEKLKAELKTIPETVIEQSSEYRMLQTKYSYIVYDNIQLKKALDETRVLLESTRAQFHRQLEQMEADELTQQKRLGNELMQLEEQLCQLRKENDLLRIEYEQNMATNEQTGPINKEMRSLITTLQTNNKLLKSENVRYKKRVDETQVELDRAKKLNAQLQAQVHQLQQQVNAAASKKDSAEVDTPVNAAAAAVPVNENVCLDQTSFKKEEDETTSGTTSTASSTPTTPSHKESSIMMAREIRELKDKNKRLQDTLKEMKSLIETYSKLAPPSLSKPNSNGKATPEASSTTTTTTATGSAPTNEVELKRLRELFDKLVKTSSSFFMYSSSSNTKPCPISTSSTSASSSYHHNIADETSHGPIPVPPPPSPLQPPVLHSPHSTPQSGLHGSSGSSVDYLKKIRGLEETIKELHKSLSNKKQEEVALLNDMEITGQAFEDMQEQNIRLIQQLREKDDANFKLVSERIKLENVQKILKEEKDVCMAQVTTLQEQHESHLMVSKKLEEQIQVLTQKIGLLEKEVRELHVACDNYKRQAIDNVQLIQELKLSSQKYLCQLKEAQAQIGEKSELLASQTFTNKRAQEEIKHLQAKIERQKRFENASNMDEVLREEIREYKEQLRCPSCKVKQKDAVLTKCFHVFCYDCLQKRYDTRQRKCPKCNANFGANDFRKLYLS